MFKLKNILVICYFFILSFILTGNIEAGLPPFVVPSFSLNNTETGEEISFGGMIYNLGSAIVVIPLISILANVAIAKSFCKKNLNSFE
jgi:sodium-independent sulfate anion transporter 11